MAPPCDARVPRRRPRAVARPDGQTARRRRPVLRGLHRARVAAAPHTLDRLPRPQAVRAPTHSNPLSPASSPRAPSPLSAAPSLWYPPLVPPSRAAPLLALASAPSRALAGRTCCSTRLAGPSSQTWASSTSLTTAPPTPSSARTPSTP
eukprot:4902133-Prymnesium_polylepis.1